MKIICPGAYKGQAGGPQGEKVPVRLVAAGVNPVDRVFHGPGRYIGTKRNAGFHTSNTEQREK